MSKLLTIREVSQILNISERTVSREVARAKLRATRVGRQVRVTQEDLDEYIESNRVVQQVKATRLEGWAG